MRLTRAGIAVLGVLAACPRPLYSGLLPVWQQSLSVTVPEHGSIPLRARELSDGSVLLLSSGTAVRYDGNGQILSTAVFSPPRFVPEGSFPIVVSVSAIHTDGRVFVASTSDQGFATSHSDIWISAFDGRTGGELWGPPAILSGPHHRINTPTQILILSDGNLAVIGIESGNGLANVLIAKVDSTTGNVLWGPLVLGSSLSPLAAVDVSGGLIVTTQKGDQAFLEKIRALDGTFAWGPVDLGNEGEVSALEPAADGGIFVSRRRFDGFDVWKRSGVDGGVVWGPTRITDSTAAVTGIAPTPAGDAVVSGWTGDHAFLLLLRGATGAVLWGPVSQPASRSPSGITVGVTPAGDLAVSGWVFAPPAFPELDTWKYSGSTGSLLWGPFPIAAALFHSTPTVLSVRSDGSLFEGAEIAAGLVGLQRNSSTGAVLWGPTGFSTTRAAVPTAVDVTQGPDGSVYVTGYLRSTDGGARWVTIRYARASGAVVWGPVYFDSDFPNGPFTVRVDGAGNAFVLGATVAGATLVKYAAADGALVWSTHPDPAPDPRGLAIDAAGNAILLDRHIVLSGPYELSTVKVSGATGSVLWGPVRHQRAGGDTFATSVSITPTGNVVSGGYVFRALGEASEWEVVQYSGATGTVLWISTLFTGPNPGPQGTAGTLLDLTVDSAGNVLLAGEGFDGNGVESMTVAKLNGADGAPVWGPVFSNGTTFGMAVAVDSHGDVFSTGKASGPDIATVKFRGSDGAILWGPRFYDGPAAGSDEGMAIALDAAEDPVVAGTSTNFARTRDVVVLRYDSATGTQNGPPAVIDGVLGHDLPLHNLVVRGTSIVVAADPFLTAAYQETETLFCDPNFPPPVASISSGPACHGQTVRLDVSGYPGAQYSWTGPGGFTSTERNPTFVAGSSTAGVYSVTVRAYGCVLGTATTRLAVGPELLPTIAVSPGQSGEPGTATVPDAGPAATYFWSVTNGFVVGPNNTRSIRFSAFGSAPVSLAVTVGNVNGCAAAGSTNVGPPGPAPSPTPGGATPDAIPTLSEGLLALFALALAGAGLLAMSPRTK